MSADFSREASSYAQREVLDQETQRRLRWWNFGLCALHMSTGIIIGILTGTTAEDSTVAWYTHLPPARPDGNPKLWKPEQQFQANVPVGYFAMIFLLLASFNHLWVSTIGWNTYLQNLSLGRNPVRWFEYGFSASLMHVHVAMLSGTMDLHLCFLIFGLTMSTMAFGYLTEPTEKGGEPLPRAFWLGFVPYVYQWLVIYCYFFTAVSRGSPPGFVWAIIIIILILDLAFAVNMYLNLYRINKWSSFLYTEIAYCVLSLTSKQLLAWLNYGGTRSLNN